jgi:hypothetical protein
MSNQAATGERIVAFARPGKSPETLLWGDRRGRASAAQTPQCPAFSQGFLKLHGVGLALGENS